MKFCNPILMLLLTILFSSYSLTLWAGKVTGIVQDNLNSELLIGAQVVLTHTMTNEVKFAVTGLDGSFSINNLSEGVYNVVVSYVGYSDLNESIEISSISETITRDFYLSSSEQLLSEVVIIGNTRGSDVQARDIERKSPSVVNVISAKQILLSPDISVANVIQRVSGLSIERNASGDPQYAIVRGMDKRYNNTLINGIKIPSPDNQNRFVPLDIFPAVFLERLEVYKSLTANMEADAIGGTVNMVMKSAPNNFLLDGDIQIGYNQMNLERDFLTYDRSNLNRRSPAEINGRSYRATPDDFPTENMVANPVTPLPDIIANLTYGDRFLDKRLGVMLGASFQNSYRPVDNFFYDPSVSPREGNPLLMNELIDRQTSSQMQRIAFHGKLDYTFNQKNNMSFYFGKYLLNEFRVRDQIRQESFVAVTNYAVYPITRFSNIFQDITTFDLRGNHELTSNLSVSWSTIYSLARNDLPDDGVFSRAGQFETEIRQITNEIVYFQGTRNSRVWERNQDNDLSAYVDFKYRPYLFNDQTEIQFGGVARNKVRDNFYNYYNYAQIFGQFRGTDWNDFSEVRFNAMANPQGSGDRSNLVYDAYEDVYAAYVNTSFTFGGMKIQAGLRAEQTLQGYEINELSASSSEVATTQDQNYLDLFPAVSLKQRINDKTNLKATYFKGISRPGFYEIVPTIRSAGGGDGLYSERGNSDLQPSYGHSVDLRYEFFPSGVDQVLIGVFYKKIIDPIEYGFPQVVDENVNPITSRILPQNFDDATNVGFEADLTKYFRRIGIRLNYTYTQSEITTNKILVNTDGSSSIVNETRSLQGQSNHIANLSLLWKDQVNQLDIQLVFNYTGERIAFVSPFFGADHIMRPMTQMDLSIEKGFKGGWVLFVKANNLLNTPYQLYVDKPLAVPTDPYPYQTDPYNVAFIRRDIFGLSYRMGARFNISQ